MGLKPTKNPSAAFEFTFLFSPHYPARLNSSRVPIDTRRDMVHIITRRIARLGSHVSQSIPGVALNKLITRLIARLGSNQYSSRVAINARHGVVHIFTESLISLPDWLCA